jgi:hypothetical protein
MLQQVVLLVCLGDPETPFALKVKTIEPPQDAWHCVSLELRHLHPSALPWNL